MQLCSGELLGLQRQRWTTTTLRKVVRALPFCAGFVIVVAAADAATASSRASR